MSAVPSDPMRVIDDLEQELLATLAEFDDEAVAMAVLDAVERVRVRSQTNARSPDQAEREFE
jgi:hypothetical protein